MYAIFTCIYLKHQPHVGKYTIHGWYGKVKALFPDILDLIGFEGLEGTE